MLEWVVRLSEHKQDLEADCSWMVSNVITLQPLTKRQSISLLHNQCLINLKAAIFGHPCRQASSLSTSPCDHQWVTFVGDWHQGITRLASKVTKCIKKSRKIILFRIYLIQVSTDSRNLYCFVYTCCKYLRTVETYTVPYILDSSIYGL